MIPTRDEAHELIRRALSLSKATEARVVIAASRAANVRWAQSGITSCGDAEDLTLTVTSTSGRRCASVSTNIIDGAGIEGAVRASEELSRVSPEDPEYVMEEGPKEIPEVPAWFEETAAQDAAGRAGAVARAIAIAAPSGAISSGFYRTGGTLTAVGTSRGFYAAHRESLVSFSTTVRTSDGTGSGWAGREENRVISIDPEALARAATGTALRSAKPAPLDPGSYTVILEPDAVAALLPFLIFSLDARLADEGRSFFSKPGGGNRIGEKVFGENVTLLSDPADPMILSIPFSPEGVPRTKRIWIRTGLLADLSCSRWWSVRGGGRPSGGIGSAIMLGGSATVDQMIASTERGLLVSRLHYVNLVDPARLALTGVTRDGTFLIENGKVRGPVNNFRFNQSLPEIFSSVEALGVPRRAMGQPPMAVPPVKVRSFTFTSVARGV